MGVAGLLSRDVMEIENKMAEKVQYVVPEQT